MKIWEETSYQLERRQTNVARAEEEFLGLSKRSSPDYKLTFDPSVSPIITQTHFSCECAKFYVLLEIH